MSSLTDWEREELEALRKLVRIQANRIDRYEILLKQYHIPDISPWTLSSDLPTEVLTKEFKHDQD